MLLLHRALREYSLLEEHGFYNHVFPHYHRASEFHCSVCSAADCVLGCGLGVIKAKWESIKEFQSEGCGLLLQKFQFEIHIGISAANERVVIMSSSLGCS